MIIRGPAGQGLLLGGCFLYPSFMPGQHLLDLQSKKGTHQKNHKDNPLIPACEEINWDCGAEQPMLMSFQLLWTSTAPTVFYLLNTKKKKRKVPISFGIFLLVLKAFGKRLFSNCLQQILLWSLICVQRWNLYLLLWLFGLRSCEQVVELFFVRRSLFELFGVPRLVLVQAQMGATRKPRNRWGLFGEDTFNASSQHQANIGHIRI